MTLALQVLALIALAAAALGAAPITRLQWGWLGLFLWLLSLMLQGVVLHSAQ